MHMINIMISASYIYIAIYITLSNRPLRFVRGQRTRMYNILNCWLRRLLHHRALGVSMGRCKMSKTHNLDHHAKLATIASWLDGISQGIVWCQECITVSICRQSKIPRFRQREIAIAIATAHASTSATTIFNEEVGSYITFENYLALTFSIFSLW